MEVDSFRQSEVIYKWLSTQLAIRFPITSWIVLSYANENFPDPARIDFPKGET